MKNIHLFKRISLLILLATLVQIHLGCQSHKKIPKPPFSMDSLASLYVQAKLTQTVSIPDSLKRKSLITLFKTYKISRDSLKIVLNYFHEFPETWAIFYKKVYNLTNGQKKSR